MQRRNASALCLVLLATAMFIGPVAASAQSKARAQQKPAQVILTDAAGRKHKVMLIRSITPAERKAAARRAAVLRTKAAAVRQKALSAQQGVAK